MMSMGVSVASVLAAIFVNNIYHHGSRSRVPACLRKCLLRRGAAVLRMRRDIPSSVHNEVNSTGEKVTGEVRFQNPNRYTPKKNNLTQPMNDNNSGNCDLPEIKNLLKFARCQIEEKHTESEIEDEWKSLAKVIDRIFFWLCLVSVILAVAVLFRRLYTSNTA